jgi:hypothetical protein
LLLHPLHLRISAQPAQEPKSEMIGGIFASCFRETRQKTNLHDLGQMRSRSGMWQVLLVEESIRIDSNPPLMNLTFWTELASGVAWPDTRLDECRAEVGG